MIIVKLKCYLKNVRFFNIERPAHLEQLPVPCCLRVFYPSRAALAGCRPESLAHGSAMEKISADCQQLSNEWESAYFAVWMLKCHGCDVCTSMMWMSFASVSACMLVWRGVLKRQTEVCTHVLFWKFESMCFSRHVRILSWNFLYETSCLKRD